MLSQNNTVVIIDGDALDLTISFMNEGKGMTVLETSCRRFAPQRLRGV